MNQCDDASLDLSREEAWVLHAAVLDRAESELEANNVPGREADLLERIEADADLSVADLDYVADVLSDYLDDAPARDREHARTVLHDVEAASA